MSEDRACARSEGESKAEMCRLAGHEAGSRVDKVEPVTDPPTRTNLKRPEGFKNTHKQIITLERPQ